MSDIARIGSLELPFGKYKGESIEDIYITNEGYLEFLANEMQDSAIVIVLGQYLRAMKYGTGVSADGAYMRKATQTEQYKNGEY